MLEIREMQAWELTAWGIHDTIEAEEQERLRKEAERRQRFE